MSVYNNMFIGTIRADIGGGVRKVQLHPFLFLSIIFHYY